MACHPEHHPLLVSLECEFHLAHTHQCCDYSLSQAAEQSGESHHVLTKLHGHGMEGKRLRIASFADTGGPELHYGQISTTLKDGTPLFPRRNAHSRTLYSAWSLLLDAQSSCVVLLVVLGRVRCLWWKMGTKLGRSQLHVRLVGGFSRGRTSHWQISSSRVLRRKETSVGTSLLSRLDAAETLHLRKSSCSDSPRDQAVPKSVEAVTEDCTESHQTGYEMLGEQSRSQVGTSLPAAMGPCAPSEPVPHSSGFVATSEHDVISGWSAGSFPLCKACRALFVPKLMVSAEWSR